MMASPAGHGGRGHHLGSVQAVHCQHFEFAAGRDDGRHRIAVEAVDSSVGVKQRGGIAAVDPGPPDLGAGAGVDRIGDSLVVDQVQQVADQQERGLARHAAADGPRDMSVRDIALAIRPHGP